MPTLHVLSLFLTGLVMGGMAFYAFFMTPLVFYHLERPVAAVFLRNVFPKYYRVMAVLSALAAVPIWYRNEALALAAIALIFVLVNLLLLPQINRARDARDAGDNAGEARFKHLHRVSVLINLAQMLAVVVVFFRLAA